MFRGLFTWRHLSSCSFTVVGLSKKQNFWDLLNLYHCQPVSQSLFKWPWKVFKPSCRFITTIRRAEKGRQGDIPRNNATVSYGNTFLLMRRFVHRMECHLSLPRESLLISSCEISARYRGSSSLGDPMSQCTRIHWGTGFLPSSSLHAERSILCRHSCVDKSSCVQYNESEWVIII